MKLDAFLGGDKCRSCKLCIDPFLKTLQTSADAN